MLNKIKGCDSKYYNWITAEYKTMFQKFTENAVSVRLNGCLATTYNA